MLAFATEKLRDIWPEWVVLARKHWDETEGFHVEQTFGPSLERYSAYETPGWFVMVTARDGGRLVGYAGFYVLPSMHSQSIISTEDTWFLHPDYRKGWNAMGLFRFAEAEAIRRGSIEATGTVRLSNPHAGAILRRMGYKEVATVFVKQLTRAEEAA